jgi:hypothetical protein
MVNEFTASTNGFAQLWTMGSAASPVSDFSNDPIPAADTANSVVAPFWDDMQVDAPANVRTATFGAMGSRRFVIEWNNVENRNVTSSSMRFQAKLFEGTNVIEFHYCSLSDAMNAFLTGSSATIGIENQDGSRGVQHSLNTGSSITLANALRFTPAM